MTTTTRERRHQAVTDTDLSIFDQIADARTKGGTAPPKAKGGTDDADPAAKSATAYAKGAERARAMFPAASATADADVDLVAETPAAVVARHIDQHLERTRKAPEPAAEPELVSDPDPDPDDDEPDDDTPPAAKELDERDVRGARRAARAEFKERFPSLPADERDLLVPTLERLVDAHTRSGMWRDPDRDGERLAREFAQQMAAYRGHVAKSVMDDLRRKGLLVEKPSARAGADAQHDDAYAKGAERANTMFGTDPQKTTSAPDQDGAVSADVVRGRILESLRRPR